MSQGARESSARAKHPEPRIRAVVVGATFWDSFYRIPVEPRLGKTVHATEAVNMPGGKGLNQAVALARYPDVHVTFITALGADGTAATIEAELKASPRGAHALDLMEARVPDTPSVALMVAGTHHGMLAPPRIDPAGDLLRAKVAEPEVKRALRNAHVVLSTLDFPQAVREVVAATRFSDDGEPILPEDRPVLLLNAAPALRPGAVANTELRQFDWLLPNVAEARALTGNASASRGDSRQDFDANLKQAGRLAEQLRDRFSVSACVTASAKGCAWIPRRGLTRGNPKIRQQRAVGTVPADVTGASDAFCAAFAYQLATQRDTRGKAHLDAIDTAVQHATAAGSLAVEQLGSSRAMPETRDIEHLVKLGATAVT